MARFVERNKIIDLCQLDNPYQCYLHHHSVYGACLDWLDLFKETTQSSPSKYRILLNMHPKWQLESMVLSKIINSLWQHKVQGSIIMKLHRPSIQYAQLSRIVFPTVSFYSSLTLPHCSCMKVCINLENILKPSLMELLWQNETQAYG